MPAHCTPPPLTCTARRESGQHLRQLLFCCEAGQLWAVCSSRPVPGENPPAVAVLQAVFCLPCQFCLPCPLPSHVLAPVQVCFAPVHFTFVCFAPVHAMCARIVVSQGRRFVCQSGPAVCKLRDCPVGSRNTGLQWRPVRRVHLTLFPAEFMILGHGLV